MEGLVFAPGSRQALRPTCCIADPNLSELEAKSCVRDFDSQILRGCGPKKSISEDDRGFSAKAKTLAKNMDSPVRTVSAAQENCARGLEANHREGSGRHLSLTVTFFTYRALLRPFLLILGGTGGGCRFEPSCSVYSEECFRKFSFFTAFKLSVSRLLKCHPWSSAPLVDPVPESAQECIPS